MYELLNLCTEITKDLIEKDKIKYLGDEYEIKILAQAMKYCDKIQKKTLLSDEEYLIQSKNHEDLQLVQASIDFLTRTYNKVLHTDDGMSDEQKVEILQMSFEHFTLIFEGISERKEYIEQTAIKLEHEAILRDLSGKVETHDLAMDIVNKLKNSNTNFLHIFDNGVAFYPVIIDLLYDTFLLEYLYAKNGPAISALKPEEKFIWVKNNYKNFKDIEFYAIVEFGFLVRPNQIRTYILHDFKRALNCDLNSLRNLYLELLHFEGSQHSSSVQKNFPQIANIASREFAMHNIKRVKKVPFTGIPHFYSDLFIE